MADLAGSDESCSESLYGSLLKEHPLASLVKDLVDAGIHFGHRSTNWNPKMKPFIYGKRNKIHIIDVKATVKGLLLARKFISNEVSRPQCVVCGHQTSSPIVCGTIRQADGYALRDRTVVGRDIDQLSNDPRASEAA